MESPTQIRSTWPCWALAFMASCRATQVALAALDTGSIAVFLNDRVGDRLHVAAKAAEARVTATMRYESPQCRPRRIVCLAFLSQTSPRHVFSRAVCGVCMHDVYCIAQGGQPVSAEANGSTRGFLQVPT